MSKQFRRTFSKTILHRKQKSELSGVSKLKSNRKHKKSNCLNKKKSKSKTNSHGKQPNTAELGNKPTSVFVTSKC